MAEEQSHREEMNAAIRAQRERQKTAVSAAPSPKSPVTRLLARLRSK